MIGKDTPGKFIDYAFIRNILSRLDEAYPARVERPWGDETDDDKTVRHISYLVGHGFILADITRNKQGNYNISRCQITPRGIDFLQPDGGLSALAAPVIRISPESLTAIIDAALAARNIPAEERSLIQKSLGIAGAEGIKVIVQRLIDAGLAHAPDLIRTLTLT